MPADRCGANASAHTATPIQPDFDSKEVPVKTVACLLGLMILCTETSSAASPRLELKQGAHVAIVGNTLADRMQHFGHFETLLHSRFPRHELVVRNLGFSGDELTLRLRSAGFGSPTIT